MPQVVDSLEQLPAGGGTNTPASGSYGDVKELADLQSALPGSQPQQAEPLRPVPPMTARQPKPKPTGLPAALFAPTNQPDVPAHSPLTVQSQVGTTPSAQRIQLLDALIQAPSSNEATRQWAREYRNRLIRPV